VSRAGAAHDVTRADLSAVYRELSRSGCRVTQQRKAIVAEFAGQQRYVTPQELHARLAARRPRIGLATVYRTLEVLERIGAASRALRPSGEASYLFCAGAHHHHAVCVNCGKVDDVPCGSAERFARTLATRLHFRLTQHRVELLGLCERCSA
jgi:Fur family transcriptional regulator, ferric uptake regulator